jgi:hypothetical protein
MRPFRARSNGLTASSPMRYLVDCIITTSDLSFRYTQAAMCYSSPSLLCPSIQIPDLYNFQIDDHFKGMISATDRRERWRLAEIRSVFFRGPCSSHRQTDVDPQFSVAGPSSLS